MAGPVPGAQHAHGSDRRDGQGPRLRTGFIDAPSNGPPTVLQAMMLALTATGTNGPFSLGSSARLRTISTRSEMTIASAEERAGLPGPEDGGRGPDDPVGPGHDPVHVLLMDIS
jgi:hypothetical protein